LQAIFCWHAPENFVTVLPVKTGLFEIRAYPWNLMVDGLGVSPETQKRKGA